MSACFVAEVSSNHGCDLERGLRFVDAAAAAGCDAVKFQQFRIRELFAPEALRAKPELLAREAWELPEAFNEPLARHARERGLLYTSTPFYRDAVGVLEPWVDFFKLASYQVLWLDLAAEVARTGKPVVLATGMATMDEVRAAVEVLEANGAGRITLLHCVSAYPTRPDDANLAAIETLRRELGTAVGWSDHTTSPAVIARAVRRWGAEMVELHLDLDGDGEEYGGGHCWLPGPLGEVIAGLRGAPDACEPDACEPDACEPDACEPGPLAMDGDGAKRPCASEAVERLWRTDPSDGLRPLLEVRDTLREERAA